MNINLTLEQLQEMNQIYALLKSVDDESRILGLEMFKSSTLFQHSFRHYRFETKPGKWIPISWFVNKAEEMVHKYIQDTGNPSHFEYLILPIVEAILLSEHKFQVDIVFNVDKHTLMAQYHVRPLETRIEQAQERAQVIAQDQLSPLEF